MNDKAKINDIQFQLKVNEIYTSLLALQTSKTHLFHLPKGVAGGYAISPQNPNKTPYEKNLDKLPKTSPVRHYLQTTNLTPDQKQQINEIFELVNIQKPEITCINDTKLRISSNFIKISDVPRFRKCSNKPLQVIEVFATDMIIFDKNLALKGKNLALAVFAPIWHVQNPSHINLDGIKASDIDPKTAGSGQAGKPGNPGNPGGSFLGLCLDIVNERNLKITANGGEGGDGQDGGDSADGGAPGLGGLPGQAIFNNLGSAARPEVIAKRGNEGNAGIAGVGGKSGQNGRKGGNMRGRMQPFKGILLNNRGDEVLNGYKKFVLDRLDKVFARSRLGEFLEKVYLSSEMIEYYSLDGTVDEFLELERHFDKMYGKVELAPLYQGVLAHADRLLQVVSSDQEKKTALYLHSAALSKVCALQEGSGKTFIVDLNTFMDMTIQQVQQFKHFTQAQLMAFYKIDYDIDIETQIKEANSLIATYIMPSVDKTLKRAQETILSVVDEIAELQKALTQNSNNLERQKTLLRINLGIKVAANAAKIVGGFLSAIPIVGSLINKGVDILADASLAFLQDTNEMTLQEQIKQLKDLYSGVQNLINEKKKGTISIFNQQLDDLKSLLNTNDFKPVVKRIDNLSDRLTAWNGQTKDLVKLYQGELRHIQKDVSTAHRSRRAISQSIKNKISKTLEYAEKVAPYVPVVTDIAGAGIEFSQKMSIVSDALKENQEFGQQVQDYDDKIANALTPLLEQMRDTINRLETGLQNKSRARLDVAQWQAQSALNNVKAVMQNYLEGFEAGPEVVSLIDDVGRLVDTMIGIFHKIQIYQQQKKLVSYISRINSIQYKNVVVQSGVLGELDMYLRSNIILMGYRQSINQVKQFLFPLAGTYFSRFNLPVMFETKNTMDDYLQNVISEVEQFKLKVLDSEVFVFKYDQLRHRARFDNDVGSTGPFVIWDHKTHHDSISRLLTGEEVLFQAYQRNEGKNAIKFNQIDLRFKSSTNQEKLDEMLTNFKVSMRHTGSNYYNCHKKTYVVTNPGHTFEFTFKKNNGRPADTNVVYEKISKSSFMLSPFTTWKIKLTNITNIDFKALAALGKNSDLEMVGEGEYFEEDGRLCEENHLDNYYKLDDMSQKEMSDCYKVLTTSMPRQMYNHCLTWYDSLATSHLRKRRDIPLPLDDTAHYASSASSFSSPINAFFGWIFSKVELLQFEKAGSGLSTNVWDPAAAFDQVNSVLVLAPIFLQLVQSMRTDVVTRSPCQVGFFRKTIWIEFVDLFREIVEKHDIKSKWVLDNLEDRVSEIKLIAEEACLEEVQMLELNLVTLFVDFVDDILYSKDFVEVRMTQIFLFDVQKLQDKAEEIPNFADLLAAVQCTYF